MRFNTLSITARDITGQKRFRARDIPGDYLVGDVVDGLLPRMQLDHRDQSGSPIKFEARRERGGLHLNRAEIVGEVLKEDDELVLTPRIMAGGE
jgi:hypothetical protein